MKLKLGSNIKWVMLDHAYFRFINKADDDIVILTLSLHLHFYVSQHLKLLTSSIFITDGHHGDNERSILKRLVLKDSLYMIKVTNFG